MSSLMSQHQTWDLLVDWLNQTHCFLSSSLRPAVCVMAPTLCLWVVAPLVEAEHLLLSSVDFHTP